MCVQPGVCPSIGTKGCFSLLLLSHIEQVRDSSRVVLCYNCNKADLELERCSGLRCSILIALRS